MSGFPRPVIGISLDLSTASWDEWQQDAVVSPVSYHEAVWRAGGLPVMLAPLPGAVDAVIALLDGLVLTGGRDLDPARYGAEPEPHTVVAHRLRDQWELALFTAAQERCLPVLGICRGMQLINVALGGTLHQHLPAVVGTDVHSPEPGQVGRHAVITAPGSRLSRLLGQRRVMPTHHHQAVRELAPGLCATAWAEDGVIEGVEGTGAAWLLGVQGHPEEDRGLDGVLAALVDASIRPAPTRRRTSRS
ncbi:gamma-glutamyl-gamma-aminobutyrate hydrolase family protein [Nocardioides daejeonensis]|uniref:gamma-glutamyl-gamma-aminobutyrate hydrolase family protein n=1 Tax=Nocardioides daejeonensis TaxID=1046556 RepID=UPI000D748EA2|nr:gamma-glutamyl-gamma-aminobutyrate hydrolase family protein [Nocardioides daejeonensis]